MKQSEIRSPPVFRNACRRRKVCDGWNEGQVMLRERNRGVFLFYGGNRNVQASRKGVRTGIDFRHLITAVFAHLRPNRKLGSSYHGSFWKRPDRGTVPKHEKRIAVYKVSRYMGCAEVRPRWSCQCFSIQYCTNTNALVPAKSQFI